MTGSHWLIPHCAHTHFFTRSVRHLAARMLELPMKMPVNHATWSMQATVITDDHGLKAQAAVQGKQPHWCTMMPNFSSSVLNKHCWTHCLLTWFLNLKITKLFWVRYYDLFGNTLYSIQTVGFWCDHHRWWRAAMHRLFPSSIPTWPFKKRFGYGRRVGKLFFSLCVWLVAHCNCHLVLRGS